MNLSIDGNNNVINLSTDFNGNDDTIRNFKVNYFSDD